MAAKRRSPAPSPTAPKKAHARTQPDPEADLAPPAKKASRAAAKPKATPAKAAKSPARAPAKSKAAPAKAAQPRPAPKPKARAQPLNTDEESPATRDADDTEEATEEDAEPLEGADVDAEEAREAPLPIEDDGVDELATVPAERALAPVRKESLANVDLLQRYMAEVTRYPLLSREEETTLAREFVKTQDPGLAERLVKANLRLVVKIAWEYRRAAFNLLDLVQEGNVGLMQGVKKFDPERGVKLSTYAAWWIRAYIIRYLMDNWRLVKLGTTQAQRKIFFNLRKEKDKLARQGITPDAKLLAEKMQVTEQEVIDMDRRLASDDSSLDAPMGDDGGSTMGDRLEGHEPAIDTELAENEIKSLFVHHLDAFAKTLEPGGKERYLFDHRLRSDEPKTLQEVGDFFGISRERARQIEARLVQRLKEYMREHLPDFEQLSLNPPDA